MKIEELFALVEDGTKIFPGYARLGKFRAQRYLDTGGVSFASGVLREVLFRATIFPHDDLIDQGKDHPWEWLTSSTESQRPPHPTSNDEWLAVHPFYAVLQGRTRLDSEKRLVYPPWFGTCQPANATHDHIPYHRILGYSVTDPRRSYVIRYSKDPLAGLHAVATRTIVKNATFGFYGLLHVPRVAMEFDGDDGELHLKRSMRGDYTHLLCVKRGDTHLLDGKFALPVDELSGVGAFLNAPVGGQAANVRKKPVEIQVLSPDKTVFTSIALVMQATREISEGEQLTLDYTDCHDMNTKDVLSTCNVDANVCKAAFPHLFS